MIPHRGERWLFDLEGNLQTLCKRHHTAKTMHESTIPIGIMYPLELPTPTRRTALICGPDVAYSCNPDVTVIDWNLQGITREGGPFDGLFVAGGSLDLRNQLLEDELARSTDVALWLVVPAPRTAERAFWSHVMGTEAQLLMPVIEGVPPEWWTEYTLDQRAEEAMQRRRGG